MFEDPNIIYEIAKQRHKELLAEVEYIQKIKSSPNFVKKKNRRLGKLILPIADLFIRIGVGLKRRFGPISEGSNDTVSDGTEP